MDELDTFIEEIIRAKQLVGLSDDVRKQLVSDLRERLLDQINRALIGALPDEKVDAFNSLLDQTDISDDQVQEFIASSGVDVKQVTVETMLRFRDLYLQSANQREA